jgi:hypothetical protein
MTRIDPYDREYAHPESLQRAELRRLVDHAVQELAAVPVGTEVVAVPQDPAIADFTAAATFNHRVLALLRSRATMLLANGVEPGQLGRLLFPTVDGADDPADQADRVNDWLEELRALPIQQGDPAAPETAEDRIWARTLRRALPDVYANAHIDLGKAGELDLYLEEFEAALDLRRQLTTRLLHSACAARAADHTWAELAALLRLHTDDDDPAHATFSWLVPGDPTDLRTVTWRCGGRSGCGQVIEDASPANGVTAEHGHASDCARRARDVAAANAEIEGQQT